MNPLLSFWAKVQPLSNSLLCSHTWKAISQSSALAPSSGDDAVVSKSATTYSWAFDYIKSTTTRLASNAYWDVFYWASSSWMLNGMVTRMVNDSQNKEKASIFKPLNKKAVALCEGYQRYTTRSVAANSVGGSNTATGRQRRRLTKTTTRGSNERQQSTKTPTALQASQQILQHQDYINYQIPPPPLRRRNSKEWVPQYKKERIDKINYNNVFGGLSSVDNNDLPVLPPPPPAAEDEERTVGSSTSFARAKPDVVKSTSSSGSNEFYPISPSSSTTSATSTVAVESIDSLSLSQPPPVISSSSTTATVVASSKTMDTANVNVNSNLSPNDVICGRGGKANTHPGNISFRAEAKKLRNWYESSSKSEKFTISSYLVDLVREKGGRFLKRDPDAPGRWLEADGNDVRKKASQALREGRKSGGGQQQ